MKDLERIFKSPEGDVYHIALSEDKGVLSHSVLAALIGSDLREGFGK